MLEFLDRNQSDSVKAGILTMVEEVDCKDIPEEEGNDLQDIVAKHKKLF